MGVNEIHRVNILHDSWLEFLLLHTMFTGIQGLKYKAVHIAVKFVVTFMEL